VDELRDSGAPARVLKPGDRAPAFALPNAEERLVDSRALLEAGPLVVTFYRGRW
jgi:peroxiredoxin